MRTRRIHSSSNSMPAEKSADRHQTVLLHEVVDWLAIKSSHTIVDSTVGSAGHASLIAERLGKKGTLAVFDADSEAIALAKTRLADAKPRVIFINENFRSLKDILSKEGIKEVNGIVFDLGWRSEQLEGRGLSFLRDEPLVMTFDKNPKDALTAHDIVNMADEKQLADIIYEWGEEHFSRHIAKAIVARRKERAIERTADLADIIARATPAWYRKRRIHPATKTFQAIRIAVNDEIHALNDGLKGAHDILAPYGRIVVISFHSIEDRVVKHTFRDWEQNGSGKVLTKKPQLPTEADIARNPRSRSAKLRVYEKFQ